MHTKIIRGAPFDIEDKLNQALKTIRGEIQFVTQSQSTTVYCGESSIIVVITIFYKKGYDKKSR